MVEYNMNEIFKIFGDEKTVKRKKTLLDSYQYYDNQGNEILYFDPMFRKIYVNNKKSQECLDVSTEYTLEDVDFLAKILSFKYNVVMKIGKCYFSRVHAIREKLTIHLNYFVDTNSLLTISYSLYSNNFLNLPVYKIKNSQKEINFSIEHKEKCSEILDVINSFK